MAFLKSTDYDVQLRSEIASIIDPTTGKTKLLQAEKMAIAQIRNHIAGRYDCSKIFIDAPSSGNDLRDQYIVMLTVDIALYHLWSKEAPNKIPKHRELRYKDALDWLIAIQGGKDADLPELTNDSGEVTGNVRIWSKHLPEDNRY